MSALDYQHMTIAEMTAMLSKLEVENRALAYTINELTKNNNELRKAIKAERRFKQVWKSNCKEISRELRVIKEAHSIINNCYA